MSGPDYDFAGQVAIVTGASPGMGLATAQAFAEAGARVVLADINEDALRSATESLTAGGYQALGVGCDVTDEDQAAALLDRTVAAYGRLDMAFNNAGIMIPPSDAADELAEIFDRVNAINLRGSGACMKHELRQMRDQGSGAIVNCSSLGGLVGLPGRASYHASSTACSASPRVRRSSTRPAASGVNAVCPGTIDTPMVDDMSPKASWTWRKPSATSRSDASTADEIAAAVPWLCSPGASFVIGVALPVDGGYTAH